MKAPRVGAQSVTQENTARDYSTGVAARESMSGTVGALTLEDVERGEFDPGVDHAVQVRSDLRVGDDGNTF